MVLDGSIQTEVLLWRSPIYLLLELIVNAGFLFVFVVVISLVALEHNSLYASSFFRFVMISASIVRLITEITP